ncbi:MAG: DMT family transporter [Armatimonadota bacterium]
MPILYVFATVWLWSLIPLAVKVAYQSFNFAFIGLTRLVVGSAVFLLFHLRAPRSPGAAGALPGPKWLGARAWMVIAGLGIGGDQLLYTLGLRHTTASAATLIVSTDGVILALLGVLVLGERMSWMKMAAATAALAGLVLVSWNGQDLSALVRSEYFLGNVIVFSAGLCWANYGLGQSVLAKTRGSSLVYIFLVGTAVGLVTAATQPPTHGPVTWQAVAALAYLGLLGTGLAYVLLTQGMKRLEAATIGVVSCTLPLMTMVEARLLLHEQITVYLLAGAALVSAAVLLIVRHQRLYGQG